MEAATRASKTGSTLSGGDIELLERCGIAHLAEDVAQLINGEQSSRVAFVGRSTKYGFIRVVPTRSAGPSRPRPLLLPSMSTYIPNGNRKSGTVKRIEGEGSAAAIANLAPQFVVVPQLLGRTQRLEVWEHFDGTSITKLERTSVPSLNQSLDRVTTWRTLVEKVTQADVKAEIRLDRLIDGYVAERPHWQRDDFLIDLARRAVARLERDLGANAVLSPVSLVHADLSFANILYSHSAQQTAVVDFEHAHFAPSIIDEVGLRVNAIARSLRRSPASVWYRSWLRTRAEDYSSYAGPEQAALANALMTCWVLLGFLAYLKTTRFSGNTRNIMWPAARTLALGCLVDELAYIRRNDLGRLASWI